MAKRRLIERTDGRRKGYKPYRSTLGERLDDETLAKLDALRGPQRKPKNAKRPHAKAR